MDPIEGETIGQDPFSELTANFSETARILFSAGSVSSTLDAVVAMAVETIEGCDFAGLFLVEGDTVVTPLSTDPIVEVIDTLQHQTGEGPCLDAIAQGVMVYGDDLNTDRVGRTSVPGPVRTACAAPWPFP